MLACHQARRPSRRLRYCVFFHLRQQDCPLLPLVLLIHNVLHVDPSTPSQAQEEEEEARLNAAAVTIQVHMRSRFLSRTPSPAPDTTTAATASPTGKESSRSPPVVVDAGGASPSARGRGDVGGGIAARGEEGSEPLDDETTNISRATVQMQVQQQECP